MHALVASLDRGGGHGSVPHVPIDSRYENASLDKWMEDMAVSHLCLLIVGIIEYIQS
jgi:hypothetical protein